MYVARHVVDVSVFQTLLGKGPMSSARHYWITVSIWSLTMLLALSTDDLGAILEIFGAFGASVSCGFLARATGALFARNGLHPLVVATSPRTSFTGCAYCRGYHTTGGARYVLLFLLSLLLFFIFLFFWRGNILGSPQPAPSSRSWIYFVHVNS